MIDLFFIKLVLAFIVGSLWVTVATLVAEKFGSKIGGAISGVPSVVVIGLFFIAWTQSPSIASQSTTIVPIVMGINALVVALYIFFSRYSFPFSILISLSVWFILSLGLVFVKFDNLGLSLLAFIILLIFSYILVEKILKIPSTGKKPLKRSFPQLLFRATLSGGIIALAVILTKFGGPVLGGAFASFPGMMFATMIITYVAHGREFSAAVTKTLMIAGPLNCVIYALCVGYFYQTIGIMWGTALAFCISLMSSYVTYLYLSKKTS